MRNTKIYVLVFVVATLFIWPTRSALAKKLGTIVETENGLVIGTEEAVDEYETWSWKGIPFAQPPERWKAPLPPEDWGVLMADTFGPQCFQYTAFGTFSGSEDCLYLNVWRPRTQQRNLPVYFWIHGGGNSIGTGSDPMFYGDKLAPRANMVVVTINYRLGPLGWFALPENLLDGDPLDDSGNYGTLDIIQALRWVRENIAAFGGNPHNIVIVGESAGGFNVFSLLISPEAKDLFHKAISESGGFFWDTNTIEDARASTWAAIERILANDGCTDSGCYPGDLKAYLMGKSPEEIFGVYPFMPGFGMLDRSVFLDRFTEGTVISALGKQALENPKTYNQVPTILGTNKEEYKLFMYGLHWMFGGPMGDGEYQDAAMAVSDLWQQKGVDELAAAMTANKGQPDVFVYRFDYGAYNESGYNAWPYPLNFAFGAMHTIEMPFIFGHWTLYTLEPFIFRQDNQEGREALNDILVEYWSSFARTGKPRNPSGVLWNPWSNKEKGLKRIVFDADATQPLIEMIDQ